MNFINIDKMSGAEIKIKIFRQIDSFDSDKLNEFYGMMLNFINSKKENDEWIGVTDIEKKGIESAIKELDSGKGITHEQVLSKIRKKRL